ncbi:MAG: hypothetical protein ACOC1N_03635, partial [Bacillota bacterium]
VQIMFGSGEDGVIFDFGVPVNRWGLFDRTVNPGFDRALKTYLLSRMAPPIFSLYDEKYIDGISQNDISLLWNNKEFPEYKNMSIFVSHIHQDHMALLPYLKEDINVYMNNDSHSIYRAVVESGEYYDTKAKLNGILDGGTVDLGDIELRVLEMEHGVPGASGVMLSSDKYKIAYTGDWRKHGYHPDRIEKFIEVCKNDSLDILITEGTALWPNSIFKTPSIWSETDIAEKFDDLLSNSSELVYLNILARNVERTIDFIKISSDNNRLFVMDNSTVRLLVESINNGLTVIEGNPLDAYADTIRILDLENDMRNIPFETIDVSEIVSRKEDFVVFLTYQQLPLMIEFERLGNKNGSSQYFHADGDPLNGSDPILKRWIKEFDLNYHYYSTGGHARPHEIKNLVESINPRVVIPLHSNNPTLLYTGNSVEKYYPAYGEIIQLDQFFT